MSNSFTSNSSEYIWSYTAYLTHTHCVIYRRHYRTTQMCTHTFLQNVSLGLGEWSHAWVLFPNCAYKGQTKTRQQLQAFNNLFINGCKIDHIVVIDDSGFFFFIEFVCTFNFLLNTHYSRQKELKKKHL